MNDAQALTLTDEQERAAAARRGSMLLSAAAGSGKTAVLVERFVRAVAEDGVDPARILAITFTERAAGELRERVRARLAAIGLPRAARETEGAAIGTIHGFCARVLRAHPLAAGVDPAVRVLDGPTAERLQRAALRAALAELVRERGGVELLAAYGVDRLSQAILDVHGELRSRGERHPRLPPAPAARVTVAHAEAALAAATEPAG
ncbi:MAG TPA: UvrD-helicase domain-containing protein, partial [Solirubrobacteraceae bacterium]|nr:UvrD-helicase domain-containing protein [Solirubrobacteraceae bacterium]